MDMWQQIFVFAVQTLLIVGGIGAIALLIALLASRGGHKSELEIERLDQKWKGYADHVRLQTSAPADLKKLKKERKKQKKNPPVQKPVFVLDFKGDIKASAADHLREEINALLPVAQKGDEVVVRLESQGGVVHGYGLAAAQLLRLKQAGLKLTVCLDKVAASGGYLMACTADRIFAAPFAIVGSIGVVAQVPNLHRLLKKHDVDYKEYTAGEFKRTVSLLGEVTEKGEQKFKEQLEDTHLLFKDFVHSQRPQLDLAKVATGEYWYGQQALSLGLVDEIKTSDEHLLALAETHHLIHIRHHKKHSLPEMLVKGARHLFLSTPH